jgi:hypothetical protein
MKINSAMIESYVRNLLGQLIGAATIVSATSNIDILSFGTSQWKLVANALWASLVPVILRYVNKKDPAFGLIAVQVTDAVTQKVSKKASSK